MAFNSLRHCFASCFKARICSFLERISCFFSSFSALNAAKVGSPRTISGAEMLVSASAAGALGSGNICPIISLWEFIIPCMNFSGFPSAFFQFSDIFPIISWESPIIFFIIMHGFTEPSSFWQSPDIFCIIFLGVSHHFLHHHAWVHRTIFILAVSRHLLHHFLHEHSRVRRAIFVHTAHLLHVSFHHLAGSWLSFCLALFCVLLHHFAGHRFAVFFALFRPLFPHLLHFLARHFVSFVVAPSHHFLPEVASTTTATSTPTSSASSTTSATTRCTPRSTVVVLGGSALSSKLAESG